jgi:hypothetical protein
MLLTRRNEGFQRGPERSKSAAAASGEGALARVLATTEKVAGYFLMCFSM